jgi:hypothetical protein
LKSQELKAHQATNKEELIKKTDEEWQNAVTGHAAFAEGRVRCPATRDSPANTRHLLAATSAIGNTCYITLMIFPGESYPGPAEGILLNTIPFRSTRPMPIIIKCLSQWCFGEHI